MEMANSPITTTAPLRDRHEPQESCGPCESRDDRECRISHGPRDPHDIDEAEAEGLRRALQASRCDTEQNRAEDTSGVGPSRDPSHSASCQASSSQLQAPAAPVPDPASNHHNYEVAVIQRFGTHFPNPAMVKWPGFACIPLPNDYTVPHKGLAIVHGPSVPPKPEDATSYLEMWAGFAIRRTVPDPFRCLFEATRSSYNPLDARNAMLGYGIMHWMANAHDGVLDQHTIHTFLVTLTAFECTLRLSVGRDSLWWMLLEREPEHSFDNWGELQAFINFEASSPRELRAGLHSACGPLPTMGSPHPLEA
jgi:hypothetical protein